MAGTAITIAIIAASSIARNLFIVTPSALYFANVIKYTIAFAACQARGMLRNAQRARVFGPF